MQSRPRVRALLEDLRHTPGVTIVSVGNGDMGFEICGSLSHRDMAEAGIFSLTPTILQALNRLREVAGMTPLKFHVDGTIDVDALQFRILLEPNPFWSLPALPA